MTIGPARELERLISRADHLLRLDDFQRLIKAGVTLSEAARSAGVSPQSGARFAQEIGLEYQPTSKYAKLFEELLRYGESQVAVEDVSRDRVRIQSILAHHRILGPRHWETSIVGNSVLVRERKPR